jgi:hypothetical protein
MALVRQMVLFSSSGRPMRTRLTESVQMRVYRAIHFDLGGTGAHSQDFFEFRLSREGLLSGHAGGLRAVVQGEKEFAFFRSHGTDMFERENEKPESWEGVVLLSCSGCHEAAGMHSFLSIHGSGSAREQACHPSWSSGIRHVKVPSRFCGSSNINISLLRITKLLSRFTRHPYSTLTQGSGRFSAAPAKMRYSDRVLCDVGRCAPTTRRDLRPAVPIRPPATNRPWHPTTIRRASVSPGGGAVAPSDFAEIVQGHVGDSRHVIVGSSDAMMCSTDSIRSALADVRCCYRGLVILSYTIRVGVNLEGGLWQI